MTVSDNFDQEFQSFSQNVKAATVGLAVVVANEAVNHFRLSFTKQSWASVPWKKRKNNVDPGRAILVGKGSGKLKRSIKDQGSSGYNVIVGSDMPYASAHNEGFKGTVTVGAHKRDKKRNIRVSSSSLKTRKTSTRNSRIRTGEGDVIAHTRKMNLPKRQFMGNSPFLNKKIDRAIINHLQIFLK